MKIICYLFPCLRKKTIIKRYRHYLKNKELKEAKRDIREWVKSEN